MIAPYAKFSQVDTTPSCCNFGHVGPSRAAALLRGKRLVFIGDSQTRRHLWALVDAVGGAKKAIRRQYGHTVADSHREFDQAAVALNDTLYDSQRAYHAGQTVLLNVDTGRWKLIDPGQLCGVGKKYWMTDHRLVGALRKGLGVRLFEDVVVVVDLEHGRAVSLPG